MIIETKWRLTRLFSFAIIIFSFLLLAVCYFYLHHSIIHTLENDMLADGKKEFVGYYLEIPFAEFKGIDEDEVLQVFDHQGNLVAQTKNSHNFNVAVNPTLMASAIEGGPHFEILDVKGTRHLFLYFALSEKHIGRISEPIIQLIEYENNFLRLILISLPAILLISYLLSQWLVTMAMKPITEAFRFQENFSSNVSHELQTPLTSVKGNLEVSLRKTRSPEDYQDFIATSLGEVNRIIKVLNDLYLLASSNFKKLALHHKKVDLAEQIEEILETFEPSLEEKGLTLDKERLCKLECICDEILIHRTLTNLISNAIKYSTPKGVLTITGEVRGAGLIITMDNPCQGLVPEDLKHLFDPFYRGGNTLKNTAEGKGLGLNISNYIVMSHGGKITADLVGGDLFHLTLKLPKIAKGSFKKQ